MRRRVLVLVLPLALASCTATRAPVGALTTCDTIRQMVRDRGMPIDLAQTWYPECAPFAVNKS